MWKVVWKSSGRPVTLFLTMKAFDADYRKIAGPIRDMVENDWEIVWVNS